MLSFQMRLIIYIPVILLSIYLLGCKNAPESDLAKVSEAIPADTINEGILYRIDTAKSFIRYQSLELKLQPRNNCRAILQIEGAGYHNGVRPRAPAG